ncbi:FHA domain-containing protein, partial [uncultured Cellulomonas sp.]|uniref:FHA domain-containing protein n=1 Tax=uncultured Cellulomonas sp. TaxID=189682 RepID=UPI0028E74B99
VGGAPVRRARHADRPAPAPVITEVPGADPRRLLPAPGPVIDVPDPVTAAMPTVGAPGPGLRAVRPADQNPDPGPGTLQLRLHLRFDTGEALDVTGDGLVGRSPGAEDGVVHLVPIDDPDRSVSKVHLAFGPEPGGRLWVLDRGSTNGTVLVGPDGRSAALLPETRAVVGPGWTVRFGRRSLVVHAR